MSAEAQGSSTGATAYEAASEVSLIATFYGSRSAYSTESLHRRLDDWEYPTAEKFLHPLINPPGLAADDTSVVQLGLNAPGNAAGVWETMREQLENMLEAPNLQGT